MSIRLPGFVTAGEPMPVKHCISRLALSTTFAPLVRSIAHAALNARNDWPLVSRQVIAKVAPGRVDGIASRGEQGLQAGPENA